MRFKSSVMIVVIMLLNVVTAFSHDMCAVEDLGGNCPCDCCEHGAEGCDDDCCCSPFMACTTCSGFTLEHQPDVSRPADKPLTEYPVLRGGRPVVSFIPVITPPPLFR